MDAIVPIGVYIVLIGVGLSLLMMFVFGIRSVAHGKIRPLTMGAVAVPVILLVVLGVAMGDWPLAAIWSLLIMLALTSVTLVLSSAKGLFS